MFVRRLIFLLAFLPCLLSAQQNGADRVETFLYRLLENSKSDFIPIGNPALINFSGHVADWAKEVGLTPKQAEAEIKLWTAAQNNQENLYRKGLANFYQKQFGKAAQFFNQSVITKSEQLKKFEVKDGSFNEEGETLIQEGVRDLRLLGHVLHQGLDYANAIKAYQQALPFISKEVNPDLWAATVLDIGQSLADLAVRNRKITDEKALDGAQEAFQKALEVFKRETHPGKWAEAQNSLAETDLYLGLRTKNEKGSSYLSLAQTEIQNALQTTQREKRPYFWARIQSNLGIALSEQAFRKTGEESNRLILDSISAYRRALEVRTFKRAPGEWAQTQSNLATTYYFLKDWPKVAECNTNVLKVFPDSKAAYQDASELYQKVLFDFEAAFQLNKRWLERHPDDLIHKIKLIEKYFTTSRFTECQAELKPFKQSEDYSALVYSVIDILDISSQLALNKSTGVPAILDGLIARLIVQGDNFKIGLNLDGVKTFVSQNESLAPHRAWLGQFYAAVAQENRDTILKSLQDAKANFKPAAN